MSSRRLAFGLAALAVAGISLFCVYDHTREDSLSADEPVHLLAGYFQAAARTAIVNIEHPPLMKLLAGLALLTLPLPPPPELVPMGTDFTGYGHAFLFSGPVSPDRIAAAARAPFLLVFFLLLLLVYLTARARHGDAPALFAVALLAFDPNFVAHAGVVHTDLGAAATFLASVLAWEAARQRPTIARLALAGAALGIALVTKFSAIYLFPILLLQGLLGIPSSPRPGRDVGRVLGSLCVVGLAAVLVVLAVYGFVTSGMNLEHQQQVIHEMVGERGAPALSGAIQRIARFSPALGHYLGGLASVIRQNAQGGGPNFLSGRVSVEGFPFYFFVAFLCKTSIAFLAVTTLGVAAAVWRRIPREEVIRYLVPVGILFLASVGTTYNIGIRHLLPVYPFLALLGAGLFARALQSAGRRRALLAGAFWVLPLLSIGELARIHPHELSYFNPFVGGPLGGREILSDSNVDWGLDLKRLATELSRRGIHNPTVVYFGGDDVRARLGVPPFAAERAVRGRTVAISAFHQAVGPEFFAYHGAPAVGNALAELRREIAARGRPLTRVGYSIDVFDLPPKGAPDR